MELNTCPFCGCKCELQSAIAPNKQEYFIIVCLGKCCTSTIYRSAESAVFHWNQRIKSARIEDAWDTLIEECNGICEECKIIEQCLSVDSAQPRFWTKSDDTQKNTDNPEIEKSELSTCFKCIEKDICPYSWDPYNTDGDCLALK